jgi:hypothetical protein
MVLYPTIDTEFQTNLVAEFKAEKEQHIPSGKLSASHLHKPLQWQILHYLKVPRPEDDYLPMKFQRGKDVERSFLKRIANNIEEQQKEVTFMDCVGQIDALYRTKEYGILPLEIKSVTSWKFKHIKIEAIPDEQYQLQGTLYALARNTSKYLMTVVNADDFRPVTFLLDTETLHREVVRIIETYQQAITKRQMPTFIPRYKWQEKTLYSDYPEFTTLTANQTIELLKVKYPASYEKWVKLK